jgi:hypothetical protein
LTSLAQHPPEDLRRSLAGRPLRKKREKICLAEPPEEAGWQTIYVSLSLSLYCPTNAKQLLSPPRILRLPLSLYPSMSTIDDNDDYSSYPAIAAS